MGEIKKKRELHIEIKFKYLKILLYNLKHLSTLHASEGRTTFRIKMYLN